MSEKIEPALSADEWAELREGSPRTETYDDDIYSLASPGRLNPQSMHALMARANDRLPNDDPRKITREDVRMVELEANDRGTEFDSGVAWQLLAAKLASLLPPQT